MNLGKLAAQIRSAPSFAAAYLLSRFTSLESSVSGLSADGGPYTCLTTDDVGEWVFVSAADTVALADADDAAKLPTIGVIVEKPTTTTCTVRFCGLVTGLVGLTAGAVYYLSAATAGAITATPPTAPHAGPVAIAISTTSLVVLPLNALSVALKSTAANLGASLIGIQDSASQITATNVEAALAELAAKFAAGLTPAVTKLQFASGTLTTGEGTISTNIVVTANTRAFPVSTANITGSTNFGSLAHIAASNVVGGAGVGSVLIRALGNDGAEDVDASGTFAVILVN